MTTRSLPALALALALALLSHQALAEGEVPTAAAADAKAEKEKPFDMSLVLINGTDKGATLGLKYQYQRVMPFWASKPYTSEGSPTVDPYAFAQPQYAGILDIKSSGVIAANKDLNPHKLIDFAGAVSWERTAGDGSYYTRLGSTLVYETDQKFENRQKMLGITAQLTASVKLLSGNDMFTVIGTYGDVKPEKDEARKKVEGNLDSFKRWSAEATFSANISGYAPSESVALLQWRQLHVGYRHYQEVGASAAIKAAGIDRNRLGYVRLVVKDGYYVQYARGSLPFDLKSDRVVEVGLTKTIP